jgi:large repetitive protein
MPPTAPARTAALLALLLATVAIIAVVAPPAATAVDGPSNLRASAAVNPVLSWDRVPGATGYDVEISRAPEFTSASRIGSVVSTVNVSWVPPVQLPFDTVYWRVRAKVGSTPGDYSAGSFETDVVAAPRPVRPLEGAAPFQAPQAPHFTWEPVAGAVGYTVQVSPDRLFTDSRVPGYASLTQKSTAAYLTAYQPSGTYYWRVRAELGTGYSTAWTDPVPYVVRPLDPVERTYPLPVVDPQTGTESDRELTDVVLDWAPVRGAATYELQVSTDNGFLENTLKANVKGIVGTAWSPSSTLNNTTYYWRVRAVDASGNPSAWPTGEPWRFRRSWPDQPHLVHPVGTVDGTQPFFYEWDPIERASEYRVLLFDSAGVPVCTSSATVHTTLAGACVPTKTGDYTWRVQAKDNPTGVVTDTIAPGFSRSFHYEKPTPPAGAPVSTLSTAAVTGQRVSITGTGAFDADPDSACAVSLPDKCENLRQTPVLTWDPVEGATSYRLTVAYDAQLTNLVPGYEAVEVSQAMYTFTRTLPDSQAGPGYFWVVQPCSGIDCAPIAYPRHGFAKKSVAPRLLGPVDGAQLSDDVTLTWGTLLAAERLPATPSDGVSSLTTAADVDAQRYQVQTSTDPSFGTVIDNVTVDQTTFTSPTTTYPEGPVYWRVRAIDATGNPTVWSEDRVDVTAGVGRFVKDSPRPTPTSPAAGAALGQDVTFRWDALDFAASYEVEVYAGGTKVASGTTKHDSWAPSDPLAVSASVPYSWRVRRIDAKGRQGQWSSGNDPAPFRTFQVEGFQPATTSPDVGGVVPPTGALFTWLPDARATSYRFERRRPNDPTNAVVETVTTRATAYAPVATLPAGATQWRVVALDASGKDLGSSPWRDFAVVDPPATLRAPNVSGSGRVGTEVTATEPGFDPAAESVTYQWYRVSYPGAANESWSRITGATGMTYALTSADYNASRPQAVAVEATGALTGYKPAVVRSSTVPVVPGDALVALQPPVITGEPVVGRRLEAVAGTWPEAPALTRQWFRDGTPIERATGTSYTLVAADLGADVTVVETARATGRTNGTATSDAVRVVAPDALVASAPPVVTGTPKVGQVLTATSGTWPVAPRLAYQWFRNGAAIDGATRAGYTVTAEDAARSLHVEVTATASGWSPGTAASAARAIARMASTTTVSLSATKAAARQRVTLVATVSASGTSSPGGAVTVYDGARRLTAKRVGSSGSLTYKLPRLSPGRHTIKVAYAGTTQVAPSSTSARLTVTRR